MNKYKIIVSVPYYRIDEYEIEAETAEDAVQGYNDGLADLTWEGGLEGDDAEDILETVDITEDSD